MVLMQERHPLDDIAGWRLSHSKDGFNGQR
jgi:hypothetical protein